MSLSCRTMLLLCLLACLGHNFVVENPGSTVLGHYPRFQFVFRVLKMANVPALLLHIIPAGSSCANMFCVGVCVCVRAGGI